MVLHMTLKFIDNFRFMSSSLSGLIDNLSQGLHNKKCRKRKSCFDYISIEDLNQYANA